MFDSNLIVWADGHVKDCPNGFDFDSGRLHKAIKTDALVEICNS